MFVSYDKNRVVVAASDHPISIIGNTTAQTNTSKELDKCLGKRFHINKSRKELKVAVMCNWNVPCGISTYTKFLVNALTPLVQEVMIFSEVGEPMTPDGTNVIRCWERGKNLRSAVEKIVAWKPDLVIVQHEYGIFPNACYFLQMLEMLDGIPTLVAMHSVYEHLDKTICSSAVKNMIVHSEEGKEVLRSTGHINRVFVVPHGCHTFDDNAELWNIFQTPYAIVQFGFGFFYKGVDRALDAIHHLKSTDKKFENIFYCYICAENPHNSSIHDKYYNFLIDKAKELGIWENITIVRGYQSDKTINNYLRTAKLAIFPYVNNPNNVVFGASGAVRIAMANRIPLIASESHLFDDLQGVVPRPADYLGLAKEIDKVFSNGKYRDAMIARIAEHTKKFSWNHTANRYLDCYQTIISEDELLSE